MPSQVGEKGEIEREKQDAVDTGARADSGFSVCVCVCVGECKNRIHRCLCLIIYNQAFSDLYTVRGCFNKATREPSSIHCLHMMDELSLCSLINSLPTHDG